MNLLVKRKWRPCRNGTSAEALGCGDAANPRATLGRGRPLKSGLGPCKGLRLLGGEGVRREKVASLPVVKYFKNPSRLLSTEDKGGWQLFSQTGGLSQAEASSPTSQPLVNPR